MEYRLLHALEGHKAPINCAAFSEDGLGLGTGGDNGSILLWSVDSGTLEQRIKTTQGPITALKWLHNKEDDGRLFLASAGADGTLHLRSIFSNFQASKILCVHTLFEGPVEDLAVDDGHTLIAATGLGRIVVLSISLYTSTPLKYLIVDPIPQQPSHRALARTCHFFDNGKSVMVCFLDSKEYGVECFTMDTDLAPQAGDKNVKLLPSCSNLPRIKLTYVTCSGSTAYHDMTKSLLVWNLHDGVDFYRICDSPTERLLHVQKLRIKTRDLRICGVQFDVSGRTAIVGGDNGEVCIWDIESAKPMQVLSHGKEQLLVQTIAFHASQTSKYVIASCTSDAMDSTPMAKVWSTAVPPKPDTVGVEYPTASSIDSADMSAIAPFVVFTQSALWTIFFAAVGMVLSFILGTLIQRRLTTNCSS